jgi:hypothetical protein
MFASSIPAVRIATSFPPSKNASISFVLSTGLNASGYDGYQLRRDVVTQFISSGLPFKAFLSSRRVVVSEEDKSLIQDHVGNNRYAVSMLGDSKLPLFESMFHIAVENSVHDNYFTEKILDCFRTFTIPIYWGTDAVLDIFDRRGIIFARDLKDIQNALASLTIGDYWSRLEAMAKNHEIAGNYMNPLGALKAILLKEFEWSA